ncbi:hypothetical protein ABZ260_41895 [Streptosporangium sp. NPDC006013]|uniref:hypothetical protein n=1 Tax=Streptosporangium sp. NPDC006013 TaxID=3155596 RepID=UPI0033B5FC1C
MHQRLPERSLLDILTGWPRHLGPASGLDPKIRGDALGRYVLNAAVLWTTRYLDAAVAWLRALPAGQCEYDVLDEDVARLSPLRHANLNCLGRCSFRASAPAGGGLQSLRGPAAADLDEEEVA